MKWMITCLLVLLMAGCLGPRYMTSFGYLGIPERESYPNTKAQPIETVSGRYWRISEVADAPYADYLSAVSNGTAQFVVSRGENVYFSTEMTGDFEQSAEVRAWVTILHRWKTKERSTPNKTLDDTSL